jgi:hypothetical protein
VDLRRQGHLFDGDPHRVLAGFIHQFELVVLETENVTTDLTYSTDYQSILNPIGFTQQITKPQGVSYLKSSVSVQSV